MNLSSASAARQATILRSFEELSREDLSTAVVGIEYRGPLDETLPPVVFAIKGTQIDWKRLRAVPGLGLGDWEGKHTRLSFTVTVEDMKQFIEGMKTVVRAKMDAESWLSLMVVTRSGPQQKAFLGSVSREKAGEFFIRARNALRADPKDISIMNGAANYEAMNALQSFGCGLGLLPKVIPAKDVTHAVAVSRGGLRFNYQEHRFESIVTLRNISSEPIRAPISLVVDLSQNISLANAHARTCLTTPAGRRVHYHSNPN